MIDKISLAKGRIALHIGFMTPLVGKLKWTPTNAIPVAATNGIHCYYNADHFEKERSLGEAIFIALHEVGHCMLGHISRLGGRERKLANIAMDYALNKQIADLVAQHPALKAEVPKDALLDVARWGNMNWEAIYDALQKEQPQCLEPGEGQGPPQQGQGGGGGRPYKMFDEVLPSGTKLDEDGNPEPGSGNEGEAIVNLDKSWLIAAQAAATMAKARGINAGLLEEFISEMVKPNIDWKTQLADLMARVSRDESSWRRFNRRHLHRESYLPGMYSERVGPVAFMLDTSGSISTRECQAALGAINDLLEDCKPERIYFGQCDTQMQGEVQELTPQDLPMTTMVVHGRGGTDLNPIFDWAVRNAHDIDCLIVQTDGEISDIRPENIPYGTPVIWVATTPAISKMTFGNIVEVRV